MDESELRHAMIAACRRLYDRGLLAAGDGNISVRLDDARVLITPGGGRSKAFCAPDEIAVIAGDGAVLAGTPSSERRMHVAVYRCCPHARCVVHAHPPTATAWSIARPQMRELPAECMAEVILATGGIPVVPFALPGTEDMGRQLGDYLPRYRALILARHGALCWGEDLEEAVGGMERIEHVAVTLREAQVLGGLTSLDSSIVDRLRQTRRQLGERLL